MGTAGSLILKAEKYYAIADRFSLPYNCSITR